MALRERAERIIETANSAKPLGYLAVGAAGVVLGSGILQKPAQITNKIYPPTQQQPSPNMHLTINMPNGKPQKATRLVATSPASPGQQTTFRPKTEATTSGPQSEGSGSNNRPDTVSVSNSKEGMVSVSKTAGGLVENPGAEGPVTPTDPGLVGPGADELGNGDGLEGEGQVGEPFPGGSDAPDGPSQGGGSIDPSQEQPAPPQTGEGSWPPLPPQLVVVTDPPGAFGDPGPMK